MTRISSNVVLEGQDHKLKEFDDFLKALFESGPNTVDPVDMAGLNECADEIVKKGDK